jgi:hypothetical protein
VTGAEGRRRLCAPSFWVTGIRSAALQRQIDATQWACRSPEHDIASQVDVIKARRQDVEAVIRGQINDKCILENALKVRVGIVKGA